jgi:CheY-like chemotaxis protein
MKVFYIDDDLEDEEFFSDALQIVDPMATFLCVRDCHKAIATLREGKFKPDIIFLDINMPGMNGIDCLKAIRKEEHLKNIPVIIYSTHIDKFEIERFNPFNVHAFLTKPADFDKIVSSLRKILQ